MGKVRNQAVRGAKFVTGQSSTEEYPDTGDKKPSWMWTSGVKALQTLTGELPRGQEDVEPAKSYSVRNIFGRRKPTVAGPSQNRKPLVTVGSLKPPAKPVMVAPQRSGVNRLRDLQDINRRYAADFSSHTDTDLSKRIQTSAQYTDKNRTQLFTKMGENLKLKSGNNKNKITRYKASLKTV